MSNRAIWNVRLRHESLTKPHTKKRVKRRARVRIGLQEALDRQQPDPSETDNASE